MTVVEQFPPVAVAVVAGAILGTGIARLVEPGIDLNAFTGPGLPASLRFDWLALVLLAGGLAIAISIAIAVYSTVTRKQSLGDTLRLGDNE